jgi:hypothetical protein
MRWIFHGVGAAPGLLAALTLAGCACGGLGGPVTPATPAEALIQMPPGGPAPKGVTLSYPGFDGGAFSAVLPVRAQETLSPEQAMEQIGPILQAAGFSRSLKELAPPAEPLALPVPDLAGLAVEICREAALQEDATSAEVCAVMRGDHPPSPVAEAAMRDAYGLSFAEFKADLERAVFQYPFTQLVGDVPIDGAGISAFRREGESVSLVHGSLFNRYTVANRADPGKRDRTLKTAGRQLAVPAPVPIGEPELVLIPHGTAPAPGGEKVTALRYAWRVLMGRPDSPESWMVWADADNGDLLRVAAQWDNDTTEVQGVRWRRDPGLCKPGLEPCTEVVTFKIDPLPGGKPALRLKGVFRQLAVAGEGTDLELEPGDTFNRPPINQYKKAVCARQDNGDFRQVNVYSHLYSLRQIATSAGVPTGFPDRPMATYIDYRDEKKEGSSAYYDGHRGKAMSELWLADGQGFVDKACPAAVGERLNGAQDVTVMAHETSHLLVQRLQERRPSNWCGRNATCAQPDVLGHNIVHDFADGLAFSYASTSCFAGWTAKNLDGVDANLHCRGKTDEAGGFPRLAALPMDRFPDHRGLNRGEYANGQIAAAGLWDIRKGMRSRSLAGGTAEYWVRLLRSVWDFGFLSNTCSGYSVNPTTERKSYFSCDRDVFLYLQDLERRMVGEWVAAPPLGAGRQAVSKVLSGWANAGLFLTPFNCLDGDPATTDPAACPADPSGPETAPEAVIEIDDQDPKDDPVADGVIHPEADYLKKTGPPPRFRVWTGPNYRFFPQGTAVTVAPPCGVRYEVEAAADAAFTRKRWTSGSTAVPPGQACRAEVDLPAAAWQALRTEEKIYYRVRTWDVLGRERISTSPGAGAFKIDPPFAVINDSGKP